jgi:hypothetical protein
LRETVASLIVIEPFVLPSTIRRTLINTANRAYYLENNYVGEEMNAPFWSLDDGDVRKKRSGAERKQGA